ncbi:hypothetical protein NDU88_003166 [Pleurodeles waltl]|uniref:Uncharacterized protein n=1 Tax=Pleurodeles waltl TaxID=8319 RepID=A0AAV7KXS3_PLEWA|nr:hypothetical protein NDU88_003166 [Pleurodeles waltl]
MGDRRGPVRFPGSATGPAPFQRPNLPPPARPHCRPPARALFQAGSRFPSGRVPRSPHFKSLSAQWSTGAVGQGGPDHRSVGPQQVGHAPGAPSKLRCRSPPQRDSAAPHLNAALSQPGHSAPQGPLPEASQAALSPSPRAGTPPRAPGSTPAGPRLR